MDRIYQNVIFEHFQENRQMLFLMGPRQVGKTTLSFSIRNRYKESFYFSWDDETDRELIVAGVEKVAQKAGLHSLQETIPLLIFDEIHKYPHWKNFLKGLYDCYPNQAHILVTGSARLDVYKKGGDSLMGRYFLYRIHPITIGELTDGSLRDQELRSGPLKLEEHLFESLWEYGGYPDPFLKANLRFFNRWKQTRFHQLFQEELRDATRSQEISRLEMLAKLLKAQVGQQSSYESLARAIRVSGNTIRSWTSILQSLYYCFEVRPWSKNVTRSLLKEPKYYLWDWSEIEDIGARAENFVASHLLKAIHFWTDFGWGSYELYYLRDKDQKEVDFLITKDNVPWILVEVKAKGNQAISPALYYFYEMIKPQYAFQVVIDLPYKDVDCFSAKRPLIVPAKTFLSQLI